MNKRSWVLWVFLAVACGGKSRGDGTSSSSTGQAGAVAGNAGAGNAESCPDNLPSSEPSEGAACPTPGLSCAGYGSLSCPLTAVCSRTRSGKSTVRRRWRSAPAVARIMTMAARRMNTARQQMAVRTRAQRASADRAAPARPQALSRVVTRTAPPSGSGPEAQLKRFALDSERASRR